MKDTRSQATKATVLTATLIASFGAAVWAARFYVPSEPPPVVRIAPPEVAPPATNEPIDLAAWRAKAWRKIEPRIDQADAADLAALEAQLATIDEFFAERRGGVKRFSEAVLSLRGKWEFVKSNLPTAEDGAHLEFLQAKFEQNIFTIDDLKKVIESSIGGYVSRVQGIENRLLVDVRADLSEQDLADARVPLTQAPEQELRRRFDALLETVSTAVARDARFATSREVVSFVSGEIAAQIAVRVASAVAARLGVSAGVLGTGAAAGWATFGVGLVAAVVIDVAIHRATKAAGYDPAGRIADKVTEVLDQTRRMIVDGDPEAWEVLERLRAMSRDDHDAGVRLKAAETVESIEAGGTLGVRHELKKLHEARSSLRREALRRLVFEDSEEVL